MTTTKEQYIFRHSLIRMMVDGEYVYDNWDNFFAKDPSIKELTFSEYYLGRSTNKTKTLSPPELSYFLKELALDMIDQEHVIFNNPDTKNCFNKYSFSVSSDGRLDAISNTDQLSVICFLRDENNNVIAESHQFIDDKTSLSDIYADKPMSRIDAHTMDLRSRWSPNWFSLIESLKLISS